MIYNSMIDWIIQNDKWEHMFYSSDGMEIKEEDLKAIKEGRYKLLETTTYTTTENINSDEETWIVYLIEINPYFFMSLPHLLKVEVYVPIDTISDYRDEKIDFILNG